MSVMQNPDLILSFILAFSVVSFGFVFYTVITKSPAYLLWEDLSPDNTIPIILQRLIGVFFFGFGSLLAILFVLKSQPASFGASQPDSKTFLWLLILSVIIIPMNYFNAKSPENLTQYPQIRKADWSYSLLALSAISWIAYLFAYELMFRGFLLFTSVPILGVWPAIILNTALYSLVHIPKGNKETLGAIPFGILISFLTIETGTFWLAFFIHIVLALSNEWFSLAAHPEISLKRNMK